MNQALAETCLRYLDGDLTEDERKAFEQLLVQSPEAADVLSQLALDEQHYRAVPTPSSDTLLAELLKLEAAAQPIPQDIAGVEAVGAGALGSRGAEPSPGALTILGDPGFWGYLARAGLRTRAGKWAAAAAAMILVSTLVVFIGGPSKTAQTPNLVGTQSEPNRAAPATGDQLHANQRLTLTAGFAEITTNDGAVAILEAPATLELLDHDNAIELLSGKLVGICETESSKGFLVRTDHADITDLGTEFAVQAKPDGVDTTVFVGKVVLSTRDGATQPITTNQTARLRVEDGRGIVTREDRAIEGFARRLPGEPLVTAADINDHRFKVEVANQSFFEDAKLHTDRDHEVNGVDVQGLPDALLGADVIRTPGDARPGINQGTENLQIEIETTRPAEVYLIFWEGGDAVPAWITRDYIKTDMSVGIDYGASPQLTQASLGIGPGQSIDMAHSVWKRKQPVEGRALVAEQMTRISAYVILALPVQESR